MIRLTSTEEYRGHGDRQRDSKGTVDAIAIICKGKMSKSNLEDWGVSVKTG
jgi:hypothetical protein